MRKFFAVLLSVLSVSVLASALVASPASAAPGRDCERFVVALESDKVLVAQGRAAHEEQWQVAVASYLSSHDEAVLRRALSSWDGAMVAFDGYLAASREQVRACRAYR